MQLITFFALLNLLISYPDDPKTFDLVVSVEMKEQKTGDILLAVFKSEENFLSDTYYRKGKIDLSKTETPIIQFKLEKGSYAISLFYDKNQNGKLDKNWFGIPTEPYGFSNNARGSLGPPKFRDASFELKQNKKISISLN